MNFYDILGVSPDADIAAIQKAFRTMSLKYHPDRANNATTPDGDETPGERKSREQRNHERYVRITQARDTLVDDEKRKAYDRFLSDDRNETKDDPPQSTRARNKSKRQSRSESTSKSKSESNSREESRADDLIESYLDILFPELAAIKYLVHRIHHMIDVLIRAPKPLYHPETIYFLEEILPRSRLAREDILDAIDDLEVLRCRDLSASGKKTRAMDIYDSLKDGAVGYILRMENRVEDIQPLIRQILDHGW